MRFSFNILLIRWTEGAQSSGRGGRDVRKGGSVPLPSDAIPGEEADGWKTVETNIPCLTQLVIESQSHRK